MAVAFDPYYTWLGIPPEEQPPDHYCLLGVRQFEPSSEVIRNAADQRLAYLRTLQVGARSKESQLLLNEVAAAASCLLLPEKRRTYDKQLRARLAAQNQSPPVQLKNTPADSPTLPAIVTVATNAPSIERPANTKERESQLSLLPWIAGGILALGLLFAGGAAGWMLGRGPRQVASPSRTRSSPEIQSKAATSVSESPEVSLVAKLDVISNTSSPLTVGESAKPQQTAPVESLMVAALKDLTSLEALRIQGFKLTEQQLAELRAALPNCKVENW